MKYCMIRIWYEVQERPWEWKSDPLYTIILSWHWRWQALIVSSASHSFYGFTLLLLLNQSYFEEYFLKDNTDEVVSAKFLPLKQFFKFLLQYLISLYFVLRQKLEKTINVKH